jgi:hypothetical protein
MIIPYGKKSVKQFLALSLLMALVFGTNYHNFSVSFNDFAFVAHRLYGRSDFHFFFLLKVYFTENLFFKKIFREESFFFSLSVFALFFACSHNKRLTPQLGARCEKEESFLFYTFRR